MYLHLEYTKCQHISAVSARCEGALIPELTKKLGDNKVVVRQAALQVRRPLYLVFSFNGQRAVPVRRPQYYNSHSVVRCDSYVH
jgi:hypothetical protein